MGITHPSHWLSSLAVGHGWHLAEFRSVLKQITGNFLRVGRGDGFPVSDDYANPWPYTGIIRHFMLTVGSPAIGLTPQQERRHLERSD